MDEAVLRRRAEELGVELRYRDSGGQWRDSDLHTVAVVVDVLDADRRDDAAVAPVHVLLDDGGGPGTEWGPDTRIVPVADGVRAGVLTLADGTAVDLPVTTGPDGRHVTAPDDLPVGFHTLHVEGTAGDGECTVVVSPSTMPRVASLAGRSGLFVPAYALWDDDAPLPSFTLLRRFADALPELDTHALTTLPLYAAFLDEPFDPSPYAPASRLHWNELYLDDAALPPAPVPPLGRYLDWAALASRRRAQLRRAVDELDAAASDAVDAFVTRRPDVGQFARFMVERPGADPARRGDAREVRSHELAQYLADRELAAMTASPGATLALDLPVGCHPDGFERWAQPQLFADAMAIGAPPDTFFEEGQSWGLPPQLPQASRRDGHRMWRDLLTRAGEHASLLRIDHVMAVQRLWWIPEGVEPACGVYVRYPREELLAVIATCAAVTGTTIVGEDLGTVPEEVEEALERWDVLGMYEEIFHTATSPMPRIPARTVAGIRTHDMEPWAAFVAHNDLSGYRRRLRRHLGRPAGRRRSDLLDAVLERLAQSDSWLVTVDLDDLVEETEPHNQPGRVTDTTWRRRNDRSLSALLADPDVRRRLRLLGDRPRA